MDLVNTIAWRSVVAPTIFVLPAFQTKRNITLSKDRQPTITTDARVCYFIHVQFNESRLSVRLPNEVITHSLIPSVTSFFCPSRFFLNYALCSIEHNKTFVRLRGLNVISLELNSTKDFNRFDNSIKMARLNVSVCACMCCFVAGK